MTKPLAVTLAAASLPILRHLEPELAHRLALGGLRLLKSAWPVLDTPNALAVDCAGLEFRHPIGVAAGFDKNGDYLDALGAIGFSHIEVGTLTPRAQPGNPRPRLFRIPSSQAVVNRMGFNNKGISHAVEHVSKSAFKGIRGISIGKNADTPMDQAIEDYLFCFRAAYPVADYLAINVSSPNTARLRDLQTAQGLSSLIAALQEERMRLVREHGKRTPIFVKLAPDLTQEQIASLAIELRRLGVEGVIATNTSVELTRIPGAPSKFEGGGLSGAPLHAVSVAVISQLRSELGSDFPIIGVGGITTAQAALDTLRAGANVIQLYTGLIYRGPALLYEILAVLERERSIANVVNDRVG